VSQLSSSIPTNASESLSKYQQSESPSIVLTNDNNPQEKAVKRLLVRIVKAVKLHGKIFLNNSSDFSFQKPA
jgi:ribonucleotide monophosphatase NagD (HAD superfamily)